MSHRSRSSELLKTRVAVFSLRSFHGNLSDFVLTFDRVAIFDTFPEVGGVNEYN